MIAYLRCFLVTILLSICTSLFSQNNWYRTQWLESEITEGHQEWLSTNNAYIQRNKEDIGFLFVYEPELFHIVEGAVTEKPYLGFIPSFGDKIGLSFSMNTINDSIAILRDGNVMKKYPVVTGDSIQVWLRQTSVKLSINDKNYLFDSFGGVYANKANQIRLICKSYFQPLECYFSENSRANLRPVVSVNGQQSETQVWRLCDGGEVYIKVANVDVVQWQSDFASCHVCSETKLKRSVDEQVELFYKAYNNGFEEDSIIGSIILIVSDILNNTPESLTLCDNESVLVEIPDVEQVQWRNTNGLNLSCTSCTSVEVSASRNAVLSGEALSSDGCTFDIRIPVYRANSPKASHIRTEYISEERRAIVELKSLASSEFDLTWKAKGKLLGVSRTLKIDRYQGEVTHEVKSKRCGIDHEIIPIDYPAITPLQYRVDNIDSTTISYYTMAANCTSCTYQWDFGDGQVSSSTSGNHQYVSKGTYHIRLVVTDRLGREVFRDKNVPVY
jgi:hypothetical protein